METNERNYIVYNLLCELYIENAYSASLLGGKLNSIDNEKDRAYISNMFYGVIEKNIQFDYIIRKLVEKRPKLSVELLIKIGLYHMRYLSTPTYAAINETVELCKRVGKGGVSGFVNAVLRKSELVEFPNEGEIPQANYLSVLYSVPLWIADKVIGEYGYEFAKAFFAYKPIKMTHIRYNSKVISREEFEQKLVEKEFIKSKLGYYVTHNQMNFLEKSIYTVQSLSSMIAVNCYLPISEDKPMVLDLCGAPGGKSIYLKELCPEATIYCCDVHPHRVELIKKYAARMKSDIIPLLGDASKIFPEWIGKCDLVICDVPCSGLGVYKGKPDILINKKPEDIIKLQKLQMSILGNAKNYVKKGGVLCYSTCTIFKEENEDNITKFLADNNDFVLDRIESPAVALNDGIVKLFPQTDAGADGFFIARLRRIS